MYSLNINYKRRSFPFGELLSRCRDHSQTHISQNIYASEYAYTLFYDQLFRIVGERGVFKENVKTVGLYGNPPPFLEEAWDTFFSNCNLYVETPEDSDDEAVDTSDSETFDIYLIKSKESFEMRVKLAMDAYSMLSPGGVILIEDVPITISETDALVALAPYLCKFQDYYFVNIEHDLFEYVHIDNIPRVLVLIKKGPAFVLPHPRLTIITPSCRPENIKKIKETVPMEWVHQWLIVYDQKRVPTNPEICKGEKRIKEHIFQGDGISGNPQRNYALNQIESNIEKYAGTYFYFLDDDNVFHPHLHKWLPFLDGEGLFTFDQYKRIKGDRIALFAIDTAMVLLPVNLVKSERWIPELYNADGHYIIKCFSSFSSNWTHVKNDLCFYNYI